MNRPKQNQQNLLRGLGVGYKDNTVYLFYSQLLKSKSTLKVDKSDSGFDFRSSQQKPVIKTTFHKSENVKKCTDFRIVKLNEIYLLTYKVNAKKRSFLAMALSQDLIHWQKLTQFESFSELGTVVPEYGYQGKFVFYYGEKFIKVAFSQDFKTWQLFKRPVLEINEEKKGLKIKIANVFVINEGILLAYYLYNADNTDYVIKVALFDKKDPKKLLWQADAPIWTQANKWLDKQVYPLGVLNLHNNLISFWDLNHQDFVAVNHRFSLSISPLKWQWRVLLPFLNKHKKNPLLKPIIKNYWESKAVFNPTAVYEDQKVHLVYRAVGEDDVSVLGYASSKDGLTIDKRLPKPIYTPREKFEGRIFRGNAYKSGIGSGGCEDPRITKIDNRFYMTYIAYDGGHPPRVALTSISKKDFLNQHWNWTKSVLISKPGVVDKNACILPEKINGKFVIFHRIYPNILIDFVDNLNFDGQHWLKGEYRIEPRQYSWDSRKIGVGPTPIKTKDGWLTIYHAVDDRDPSKYKMGAMLLALNNPTKVLYRTVSPILEPDKIYENEGYKSGVAYPCGAVVVKEKLFVYYGGADKFVCAATAPLNQFLYQLKNYHSARLDLPTWLD